MTGNRSVYRVTLPTADVPAFLGHCQDSEWYAFDTGERIMTDDGVDAEAVLLVEPTPFASRRGERAALVVTS